jgi:cardiolipin synthase A/B
MAWDVWNIVTTAVLFFNMLAVFYIIFFERRNPANAIVWILALIFVPILGFILYLLFGQQYYKQKRFAFKAEKDRETLQRFYQMQKEAISEVPDDYRAATGRQIVRMLLAGGSAYSLNNETRAFVDGKEKFNALIQAIRGAEHFIHMEYYIIRNDDLGNEIVAALTEKARQGVEVRFLVDGLGNNIPEKGYRDLVEAGGKVAEFYKTLIPSISLRVNYHNHRKIVIVDGKVGFVGGFNIGDEYLGKGPLGYWRDAAVEIRGEGVKTVQYQFMVDWNYATKEGLTLDPKYFPVVKGNGRSVVQIVSGGPDHRWNPIKEEYLKLINVARKHVYLQTPYFIPDQSVLDALRIAALSGVDVRIMFPNKPDHPLVYWASYSYVAELLDAGVRAYTYDNGFIHAKTVTVDDEISSIGSANWDIRSFRLNFETNAVIYDKEFGVEQRMHFEDDLKVCTEVTMESYQNRPVKVRIKEGFSRLLSGVL